MIYPYDTTKHQTATCADHLFIHYNEQVIDVNKNDIGENFEIYIHYNDFIFHDLRNCFLVFNSVLLFSFLMRFIPEILILRIKHKQGCKISAIKMNYNKILKDPSHNKIY